MPRKNVQVGGNANAANTQTPDLSADRQQTTEEIKAALAINPIITNANTSRKFSMSTFGEVGFQESIDAMHETVDKASAHFMTEAETMLLAQAVSLDAIYNQLAQQAARNVGEFMNAAETYMRLALKAQAQCRATWETVHEMRHPRPVAFVRQANIAQTQQVNNGHPPPDAATRAGNSESLSNELSGATLELPSNAGTPAVAFRADTAMETVGKINGATDAGGQGQERVQ